MIPAKYTCPSGSTSYVCQNTSVIVDSHYECIDIHMESIPGSQIDIDGDKDS